MSKLLALFPGQGSQHVGMLKELHENFAIARQCFEEASDAVKLDIKKLCFDGPESDLTLTENTQPCLLTASVAAFRVAQLETGFKPDAVAGHSLGEYSALVAAGALPLASAAAWVKERGRSMQAAVPAGQGTMAAIMGLEDDTVTKLCAEATEVARKKRASGGQDEITVACTVESANFNAPGQVVVAGSKDAVAEAVALLKSGSYPGGKAIPLQVSAPFHCSLMIAARKRMSEIFSSSAKPKALSVPYFPNRTARLTGESGVIFDLLIDQVDHPVLWSQTVSAALTHEFLTTVECGPGKVLSGLVKRISQKSGASPRMFSVSDVETLKSFSQEIKA